MLELSAVRVGVFSFAISASATLSLYESRHGFRAGNRYMMTFDTERRLGSAWGVEAGLSLANEQAEKWDGLVEEEGNLGRTDLFLGAGLRRTIGAGSLSLRARVPVATRSEGHQVSYPVLLSIAWSR